MVASPKTRRPARHEQGTLSVCGGMRRVVVLLGMVQTHAAYALECVEVSDHWKVKHRDQSPDPIT